MKKTTHSGSPRWARRLLRRFCAPHLFEEVEGDLEELFQQRVQSLGLRQARWRYIQDVISLMRPSVVKRQRTEYKQPTHTAMLRNVLKISLRNLVKHKSYSFLNIAGLAVGMAVAMLIGLWIQDEFLANRHHKNYETLYQIKLNQTFDGVRKTQDAIPFPLGDELRSHYPDFKAVAMYERGGGNRSLIAGNQKFVKSGFYIGEEAIAMFSLAVQKGDPNPLREPYSIVLTDETAQAIFGNQNPIGQSLRLDASVDLKVTAVVAKQPKNATLQFDFLIPWHLLAKRHDWVEKYAKSDWRNNDWGVYVQLKDGIDPAQTNAKINDVIATHQTSDPRTTKLVNPEIFLHPMSKWRLYSEFSEGINTGGFIRYVQLFGVFGLFVLIIACINFMNLATARSEKRAKEVGVRKAVGAGRMQLIGQFLSESILISALALVLAVGLVLLSLPYFNLLTGKLISIEFANPLFWGALFLFTGVTGLLAGSYPALYLSSFNPVKILKGSIQVGKRALLPRKMLVVVQFTFSVALMIGTIIIYQQIQYGKNRPLGFTKQGLVSVNSTNDLLDHFEALRAELLATGAVVSVCKTNSPPTQWRSSNSGWQWQGSTPEDKAVIFTTIATSYDYTKTLGINLKEGRDFSRDFSTDSSAVIVNEAAVKRMGFDRQNGRSPIGQVLRWGERDWTVVGVIPDIVMERSPFRTVAPMTILFEKNWVNFINLRINPAIAPSAAIEKIAPVFTKYNPAYPFDYQFADTEYDLKFSYEELIGNLSAIVSVLAIFISCLGLFGLAMFTADQRTKEIGVRKVLGASVTSLVRLLAADFLIPVLIAIGLATPLAWYAMQRWLGDFSYRINIEWWVFALAGTVAVGIAWLTVSFQSIKAALMNPVKSLRSE